VHRDFLIRGDGGIEFKSIRLTLFLESHNSICHSCNFTWEVHVLMKISIFEIINLEVVESLIYEVVVQVSWNFVFHVFVEDQEHAIVSTLGDVIFRFLVWLDESW